MNTRSNKIKFYFIAAMILPLLCFADVIYLGEDVEHIHYKNRQDYLDNEYTAEQILNNDMPGRKESWKVPFEFIDGGFDDSRLFTVPEPGVHPRVLFGPDDVADIRSRIETTTTGKTMFAHLRSRNKRSILNPQLWEGKVYNLLAEGKWQQAGEIIDSNPRKNIPQNHYEPYIIHAIAREAFDSLLYNNKQQAEKAAAALVGFVDYVEPKFKALIAGSEYPDNVWRLRDGNYAGQELIGQHFIGLSYDWLYNSMTDRQRDRVRRFISLATYGKFTHGMELPRHWRNWNWLNCAQQHCLLALSIEGEQGYDPRIYERAYEVMEDFFTYGISPEGSSREAVGYTAFGFNWAGMAMLAMANRGDNLYKHSHYQAMKDWHLAHLMPFGQRWISHGDGGDAGPVMFFVQAQKYFFPDDKVVDYLWQNQLMEFGSNNLTERLRLFPMLIFASDGSDTDYNYGKELEQPLTFHDPERGSMVTRCSWNKDAVQFQFEARPDGVVASHQHADAGNFVLAAHGRVWAPDGFRGVETKYHSSILIDGKGQGYFPVPATWLGVEETETALIASCDIKYCYDWFWPRTVEILAQPDDWRFENRWTNWKDTLIEHRRIFGHLKVRRDYSPSVVKHYDGYLDGNPMIWDENTWVAKLEHNPVQYAYRTAVFVKGDNPYVIIVDDIRKDDKERLYEWLMMLEFDIEAMSIVNEDIILSDRNQSFELNQPNRFGVRRSIERGSPCLLVRVLDISAPASDSEYTTQPSYRVETFEKRETGLVDIHGKGRSFGLDKRLVIGSRAVEPNFKIMLYPFRHGIDPLPKTTWNKDKTELTVEISDTTDVLRFERDSSNRTKVEVVAK